MKRSRNTIKADLTAIPATNKRVKVDRQADCLLEPLPKRIRASKQSYPALPVDDKLEDAILGLAELMALVDARNQARAKRRLGLETGSEDLVLSGWYLCEWEKEQEVDKLVGGKDDPIVID